MIPRSFKEIEDFTDKVQFNETHGGVLFQKIGNIILKKRGVRI